jgi:hypothetical protein
MFTDPFHKCPPEEFDHLLMGLAKSEPDHGFRTKGLSVLRKQLGFYQDAIYYDLTQADQHPARSRQMIAGPWGFVVMTGAVSDFETLNKLAVLKLDRNQATDYIRFYFAHLTGPHGLTTIIDTVDDLALREEPTPSLRKSLHDKIIPLTLRASLPDGGYQIGGTLLVRRTLIHATIDVLVDGQVIVTPGRVLAEVLPLQDSALEG